ncbi:uncharacterized protein A1O9_08639 [Exophiala aquamarina CBS 119918]|uniref:Phosphate transporter n=1 Tax=Exophiala aquamarina CBS 119918 TaxID=1182545 RepID=A0A072P5I7_9EURO|nr:uncharacterized protein A1O9_08639 [Exophiala aquamarina CBS 119918]KEF54987.1 hypothetical protein A1O9_08639 [Exophiala aquamarina CBS 119918]
MVALEQYDYIFAITTVFAALDAWNIGANDVANAFATSVASRSLTLKQAVAIASIMEFGGSVAAGARVTDTIRTRIIDPQLYHHDPGVLLLAMMCAIISSACFLHVATQNGFPVSTTHSIIGGLVGSGVASVGMSNISWGWGGVSQVFAAWIIAPGIAGILGVILFLITRFLVLMKRDAVRRAFFSIPVYVFITFGALSMLVVWKGIDTVVEPTDTQILISVFTVAGGATILCSTFILPFLWRRIVYNDWQLRWFHVWKGPYLLRLPPPPPAPADVRVHNITDYYRGHMNLEELRILRISEAMMHSVQASSTVAELMGKDTESQSSPHSHIPLQDEPEKLRPHRPLGSWNSLPVLWWKLRHFFLHGVEQDVVTMQKRNTLLTWNIADMHARASRYDNKAEYMYSALQIMTAGASSFIHGSNDVANAMGPFTSAYYIWKTGTVQTQQSVPIWVLCFGGAAIVLGLLFHGYYVMQNLGNKLTLISPSRGFCMELGSAITILMATRLALPVSTPARQWVSDSQMEIGDL